MKILMITRALFARSAAETAMFCLAGALERMGHEVSYFALDHQRNEHIPGAYVVSRPAPGMESRLRAIKRRIYDPEVGACLKTRLEHDRPSLALVWQVNRSLTYATVAALHDAAIPTWVMLTDYTPLCPARTMVCTHRGRLLERLGIQSPSEKHCSRCAKGHFLPCLTHRCLEDRLLPSLIGMRENGFLRRRRLYDLANGFLVPSEYHRQRFEQSRFTTRSIFSVDLPLPASAFAPAEIKRGEFFLFVGSLAERKGLRTLLKGLKACVNEIPLVIVGGGSFKRELQTLADELGITHRLRMTGHLSAQSVRQTMSECLCLIVPSECEEIAPWALLEAQALGKPAIVSDFGVLPERVENGATGYVFPAGKELSLAQRMDDMAYLPEAEYADMCRAAAEHARQHYAPEAYAQRVLRAVRKPK